MRKNAIDITNSVYQNKLCNDDLLDDTKYIYKSSQTLSHFYKLEGTARYAGLLLAPVDGFDRGQGFFCPSDKKRAFHAICAYFRPLLVFSSNLRKFWQ